jgi:hypothetical protein
VLVHINEFENFTFKKASSEGIDDSVGREAQNMWGRLEIFSRMEFIGTFKYACFEGCTVCTGLFEKLLSNITQEF